MSNDAPTPPTPPSAPKPQLPPANKPQLPPAGPKATLPAAPSKPSLPAAPKLSLAGGVTKPGFKADVSDDPFAVESAKPETIAQPIAATPSAATIARPPSIGAAAAPAATRAPFPSKVAAAAPTLVPVDDGAPKWAGVLAGLGMVASLAFAALLFLELKPTL